MRLASLATTWLVLALQSDPLPPPMLLEREALVAGNPLATYAAMRKLEAAYRASKPFAGVYDEMRLNLEEFLGVPTAGTRAMSLPSVGTRWPAGEEPIPEGFAPGPAIDVVEREAKRTRIVIFGEEHHLPQTRSLFEPLLEALRRQGYRYFAAEAFSEDVMRPDFAWPSFRSGLYVRDPIFACAVRAAKKLGYALVAYDTEERGPAGDASFRDRTQAENLKKRIFDRDPEAKVLIVAGRLHASEIVAPDGWTPMASVLKKLVGVDPLTLFAPTMSARETPEREHPMYRFATAHGLVKGPTIFANATTGNLLGFDACDAYVFWPRPTARDGRPDWMDALPNRHRVALPHALRAGSGLRLVQAFFEGEPDAAVPVDQVLIDDGDDKKALVLPEGKLRVRTIDAAGRVLAESRLAVP